MFKPKIGISMLHTLAEPFNTMLKRLATIETEYVEIVDDGLHTLNKERVAALNEAAKPKGLKYTLHCPIADINIASPSKPMLNASLKRLKQSMAYANELNAELWVLHPGQVTGITPFYPGSDWKQNIQSIRTLHKTAKEYGLRIAIENVPQKYGAIMKTTEDFARLYAGNRLNRHRHHPRHWTRQPRSPNRTLPHTATRQDFRDAPKRQHGRKRPALRNRLRKNRLATTHGKA